MSKVPSLSEISRCRTIESLQQSLDHTYYQLLQAAKADWHCLFAGQNPSDTAVTVRVSKDEIAQELTGTPCAAFALVRISPRNGTARRRVV